MEPERNAITRLMSKLHAEYSPSGWSIDYIDLRWGVSKESSAENNTMQICLNELRRCKDLSPRPNFMFLIGDRYGWLPLPEILYPDEWDKIYSFASIFEKEAMEAAYKFDSNCLPNGRFLLQPIWNHYVTEFLNNLFSRFYENNWLSATEQEIVEGLFKVADAKEHVVGYIRSLKSVPKSVHHIYRDENEALKNSVDRLKKKIIKTLPPENILCTGLIDFSNYTNPNYIKWFENEIEGRIRHVIEQEIESQNLTQSEYLHEFYFDIAQRNSKYFYGREKELSGIMSYIMSEGLQYPLMVLGEPGLGKTSLMSKAIITTAQEAEYVMIPRFIGSGDGIFNLTDLIVSIFNALHKYLSPEGKARFPHPIDSYEGELIKGKGVFNESWFHTLDKLLNPGKYVVFIDAIDQINKNDQLDLFNNIITGEYSNLYGNKEDKSWFNKFEKLRIVVSFAHNGQKIENYDISCFHHLQLSPFNITEKKDLVIGLLNSKGRTTSTIQNKILQQTLCNSESRGIYLDMIGRYFGALQSYSEIEDIPYDFRSAVLFILNRLSKSHIHNCRLLRTFLSVIASATAGIDMQSLNCILACDNELVSELIDDSFHYFDISQSGGMIPPILLSRLYFDLSGIFITTRPSRLGEVIVIKHQETLEVIKEWLGAEQLHYARVLQYKYFCNAWKRGNKFAINDIVKVMCEVKDKNSEDLALELASVLCNVDYLVQRVNIDTIAEIENDFNTLIWLSETVDYLHTLIPEIRIFTALMHSLPKKVETDVFFTWCCNLPFEIFANKRFRNKIPHNVLVDTLRYFDINKSIIGRAYIEWSNYQIPKHFALRYNYKVEYHKSCTELFKEDQVNRSIKKIFQCDKGSGACCIQHFVSQNIFVVLYHNSVSCYNLTSGKLVFQSEFKCYMQLTNRSVSVSKSGRYIIVNTFVIEKDNKIKDLFLIIDLDGRNPNWIFPRERKVIFSQSEKYLWTAYGTDTIMRMELASGQCNMFTHQDPQFIDTNINSYGDFNLCDALDDCLIFSRAYSGHKYFFRYYLLVSKGNSYHFEYLPNDGCFSPDGNSIYVYGKFLEKMTSFNGRNTMEQYPFPLGTIKFSHKHKLFSFDNLIHGDRCLYSMEICNREQLHFFPTSNQLSCSGFSISKDGKTICASNFQSHLASSIVIYQYIETGWQKKFLHIDLSTLQGGLYSTCISPAGDIVACAGYGNDSCRIQIINVSDNKTLIDIPVPYPIAAFKFFTDGKMIVAADATQNHQNAINPDSFKFRIFKVSYQPLSLTYIKEVTIPSVNGKGKIIGYEGFELLPDNKTVIFDGIIFDLFQEKVLTQVPLPTPTYYYKIYGFEPGRKEIFLYTTGGLCLAIGSGTGYIEVFDIETAMSVRATCEDTALALSPDGCWLIMRTPDYKLYRTDLSLRYKKTLKGIMPENVINILFHPIKKAFYAITRDAAIYFCNMEGEILARALAVGIIDAKVSSEGLVILREGVQVSLFTPSTSITESLPSWEFDDWLMTASFRDLYFNK